MRIFSFVVLFCSFLSAHNLQHTISYAKGVTVTLHFAQEDDFSFQKYEIYAPANANIPFQVGRTDKLGRVLFLPDTAGKWQVKLFSEDGHGKIVNVDVDKNIEIEKKINSHSSSWMKSILGLLLLFGTFGAIYFIKIKRRDK